MTERVTIRPLAATDDPLLAAATLDNLNWSEQRFTMHDVRERSHFRHYTQVVDTRGDFGVVAEHEGQPLGVAWALFLPADDPGYGFVDESTPEISLWVREGFRGQGVGRALLQALQQEAKDRGVARLSLSVETGNDAERLYATEGFRPVSGHEEDGVMVWAP
ncbi:GNAT family N-acetyltransferase [Ornithinimicrobium sediminis]|uniref:GNAT family N-acetyltransferase n=1 Tax=Ornithinimicrobium sediminis TaxID=2904603 RepID=UPI001E61CA0D|nr:GNAT family N-acetyltransferase [Ornithinimicrobium sediminis]MCE0485715.1 GNAT family N-acetyltransferase [Ornithinimicrobium sediminis]